MMRKLLGLALMNCCLAPMLCQAQSASSVSLTAFPTAVVADGISQVTITVHVTDGHGDLAPDGTQVELTTNLGRFDQSTVSTSHGVAQAILHAGSLVGDATITAKVIGPAPPVTTDVEFVATRKDLNATLQYAEVTSKREVHYSPRDFVVGSEAPNQGVEIRYGDVTIRADIAQVSTTSLEVKAKRATLIIGSAHLKCDVLDYNLETKKGFALTDYKTTVISKLIAEGRLFRIETKPAERYGYTELNGQVATQTKRIYNDNLYRMVSFDDVSEQIESDKTIIFPYRKLQFERARLIVGTQTVMTLPLYELAFNGQNPTFTDQMVSVNDNELAVTYPYYLSLKPGETSLLRFHMGGQTNYFGGGNGPQMDYQLNWDESGGNQGQVLLGGLGQSSWGIEAQQYWQLSQHGNASVQVQMPQMKSFLGNIGLSKQFSGYNFAANANLTKTLTGYQETDQNLTLNLQTNYQRVAKLPWSFTYGLTASHSSTTLPIPVQQQDGFGLREQAVMDSRRMDKRTTLEASMYTTQQFGNNVGTGGFGFGSEIALTHSLFAGAVTRIVYDYSLGDFNSATLGHHRIDAHFDFARGSYGFDLDAQKSLDLNRFAETASLDYQMSSLWSLGYSYSMNQIFSYNYLDYQFSVFYRIGSRRFGLTWSKYTHRFGIEVLGAQFN